MELNSIIFPIPKTTYKESDLKELIQIPVYLDIFTETTKKAKPKVLFSKIDPFEPPEDLPNDNSVIEERDEPTSVKDLMVNYQTIQIKHRSSLTNLQTAISPRKVTSRICSPPAKLPVCVRSIPCLYLRSRTYTKRTILYFHANCEDLRSCYNLVDFLRQRMQCNVLVMEYPGYGIYKGEPSEASILWDAEYVYKYIAFHSKVGENNIIVMGRSIGSGVACHLGSIFKPMLLTLISPFLSLREVIREQFNYLNKLVKERFPNREKITKVVCPTYILHGAADTNIRVQHSLALVVLMCLLVKNPQGDDSFKVSIRSRLGSAVVEFYEIIKFTMKRASQLQIQKEAIVFSSDDSMNSDNSFQSSVEEEETDDYKNTIFHLKEQMAQFFTSNPDLQDAIKFENPEDGKEQRSEREAAKPKAPHAFSNMLSKQDQQNFSGHWKVLGKDVIRNSQGGQTLPTLETINHRLNIFKQKVEKVDYLEILQRETQQLQKQDEQGVPKQEQKQQLRSQSDNSKVKTNEDAKNEEDEEVTYFSFKKKMQLALHKRQQMQKDEEEKKQKQLKEKMRKGMISDASQPETTENQPTNTLQGSKMEFQTHVGQMLYSTYLSTGGDKESFKKMAAIFLKNYHKKQKENLDKLKVFPPVIPKFTSDDCKHLNLLLPDFTTQLYAPNKQNLFQGVENYKFPANSPEQEFINLVDQIMQGKVMQFWKEMHQQ